MKRRILFILFFLGLSFLQPANAFATIGLSPPQIYTEGLLRDVAHEYTVKIVRSDASEEMLMTAEAAGEDAQYLQLEPTFLIPAGQDTYEYTFSILPKNAPIGEYNARVDFIGANPLESVTEGTGVGVRPGVILLLGFTVSDEEVLSYGVSRISYSPIEEGNPVTVSLDVENTGNVTWQPDVVTLVFSNTVTGVVSGTATIDAADLPVLQPGETQTITKQIDISLKPASYTVHAEVEYGGEAVFTDEQVIEVLKTGTLSQSGEFVSLSIAKETFTPGEKGKLVGVFKNTGQSTLLSQMKVELYSVSTGELMDLILSDQLLVPAVQQQAFEVVFTAPKTDVYKAIAHVAYGNRVSGSQEAKFSVPAGQEVTEASGSFLGIVIVFILLTGTVLFFVTRRKKRLTSPVVSGPIAVGSTQVNGLWSGPDGALIEVFVDGRSVGQCVATGGTWSLGNIPPLISGAQVRATARMDDNRDGIVDMSDHPSAPSRGVLAMGGGTPIAKSVPPSPASTVPISTPPVMPVVSPVPTSPTTQPPVPPDDSWNVSV